VLAFISVSASVAKELCMFFGPLRALISYPKGTLSPNGVSGMLSRKGKLSLKGAMDRLTNEEIKIVEGME